MEKHSTLTDWQNKCEKVCAAQSNLHVQCHPFQNTMDIFHRLGTNYPKIYMEPEKTLT